MDTAIMNRYKYAPVNGEPIPGGSFAEGCDYGDRSTGHTLSRQLFGNGNFSDDSKPVFKVISAAPKQLVIA
jgi:hypothetical protein